MGRNIALVATIATIAAGAAGAAARFLFTHLRSSSKRCTSVTAESPKIEDITDEEDATHPQHSHPAHSSISDSSVSQSHSHSSPSAQSRVRRVSSRAQPVLCAADVLSLLHIIAPRSSSCRTSSAQCAVCLEPVKFDQLVRTTPCRHVFHAGCLEQWALNTTSDLMDVALYTVARDGILHCNARFPSCPDCSELLDVVPRPVWSSVLLSAVSSSLSLAGSSRAAQMYRSGMVVRDAGLRALHVRIPFEQLPSAYDCIEPVDGVESSTSMSEVKQKLRVSGFAPLLITPGMTRSEQRGFGRAATYHAYAHW